MTELVRDLESALEAIRNLNGSLPAYPDLAARLGQAHAFYILEQEGHEPLFGFSKFVGYQGLTAEDYLENYKNLNGRNTEQALASWFEELRYASPAYNAMLEKLRALLAQFGKKPREGRDQKVRLLVVRPEYRKCAGEKAEDRRILDLLIAVADFLPAEQRLQLRAAL